MQALIQQHQFNDGRTLALIQSTPRTYKIIIQSATTHETNGIAFVMVLRSTKINGKSKALQTFSEWQKENA